MDKKQAIDFVHNILLANENLKPEERLQRKDIVDILVVDHKIPESTAYRYFLMQLGNMNGSRKSQAIQQE